MALPNFPDFVELSLEDKKEYNAFIAKYPPFSDISFTSLHIWWNLDGQLAVSSLNENLVLNYTQPFDKGGSGLSLIGNNNINESIKTIFQYLQQQNRTPRLVHVPEFVVERINEKESLNIKEEPAYHEYIMSSEELAKLDGSRHSYTRKKVRRFLREVEKRNLEVRVIDLSSQENKRLVAEAITKWQNQFAQKSDPGRNEDDALKQTIAHSESLDTQNLCLFIDKELCGIVLFHETANQKHYILNHLKVDYSVPYMFDFLTNQVAELAFKNGVEYLNMEMDLGIEGIKQHKERLRPVDFLKKYTIGLK